jgi:hypothetical protein
VRQQLLETPGGLGRKALEDILGVEIRIMSIELG